MASATSCRIEWRLKASEDLRGIARYIGKDNPGQARSFGQGLRAKVAALAQHPELGRTGRPGLPDYVRELVVHRNYIAFHRVLADVGVVEILRLKHVAQRTP